VKLYGLPNILELSKIHFFSPFAGLNSNFNPYEPNTASLVMLLKSAFMPSQVIDLIGPSNLIVAISFTLSFPLAIKPTSSNLLLILPDKSIILSNGSI